MHELNGLYVAQQIREHFNDQTYTDADVMKWWTIWPIYWRCSILSLYGANGWFCCDNLQLSLKRTAPHCDKITFPDSLCVWMFNAFYASTDLSVISMKYCGNASAFLLWNMAFSFAFDIFIAQKLIFPFSLAHSQNWFSFKLQTFNKQLKAKMAYQHNIRNKKKLLKWNVMHAWYIMSCNDTWLNDMNTNDDNRKEMVNMMFERI